MNDKIKVTVQEEIVKKYPQYKLGLVRITFSDFNNTEVDNDKLQTLTKYEKSIIDESAIEKEWLEVFADMKASERRLPSVVALWSIIDRFGELKPINYFVDAYNYVSIKHGIPMGGYDIKKLPIHELSLQYAVVGGTKFEPMGLAGQFEKLKDSAEICYYCGDVPVCRYWNHKDSEITKIDENSADVLIMFDSLGGLEELNNAIDEFVELINSTSGTPKMISSMVLSNQKLTGEI